MIELDREEQLAVVAEAARAPSAHNAQPARWRFETGGRVRLFEDLGRRLTVADPDGRDARISLGAAYEGLAIALSGRGLGLEPPRLQPVQSETARDEIAAGLAPVADSALIEGAAPDPLRAEVFERRTFRGPFHRPEAHLMERLDALAADASDLLLCTEPTGISTIARLHDRCIAGFLEQADYHAELYSWMRFRPSDAGWEEDGLTADCLPFSPIERALAPTLFHPRVFRVLARLGLAGVIGSESGPTRSSAVVALLHRPRSEDVFLGGRRLYRVWLELSAIGLHACPMSATADSAAGLEGLRRVLEPPRGSSVINLLRIGSAGPAPVPVSRRLPVEQLLV